MTLFQILAVAFLSACLLVTLAALVRQRLRPFAGLGWLMLWIAAGVAVLRPETTKVVARQLGIGRGADLLLYTSVLGGFVVAFLVAARLRRLERNVTLLTRELALLRPERPGGSGVGGSDLGGNAR